jgi:hypothetical protein
MVSTYIRHGRSNEANMGYAPSGATISDGPRILFDGKTLGEDLPATWSAGGTGVSTFQDNKVQLAVDSGEYLIRQGTRPVPYFSGYPLYVEMTADHFGHEAGVVKRMGAFSSSAVAPYSDGLDGFFLESDGTTYRIKAYRDGTLTADVPMRKWSGLKTIKELELDFDNFTPFMFDFLWLGGAALRLWIATAKHGWILAHSVPYVGNAQDVICKTPQHPLRYEVRGEGGAGTFRPICCQASVLGDVAGQGRQIVSWNEASVACNSTSTVYVLQGLRKRPANRNIGVQFTYIGSSTGSQNDTGTLLLLRNPTLSAALSYTDFGKVERAIATTETVTDLGDIIMAIPSSQTGQSLIEANSRRWMTHHLDNTMDEFVLAFAPMTSNQSQRGILAFKEFG